MGEVFPHLRHLELPRLTTIEAVDFAGVDLVFCALPHATSQEVIAKLPRDLKIVDLSADFRLRDPAVYARLVRPPAPRARSAGRGGLRPDRVLPRGDPGRPAGGGHRVQRRDRHLRAPAADAGRR